MKALIFMLLAVMTVAIVAPMTAKAQDGQQSKVQSTGRGQGQQTTQAVERTPRDIAEAIIESAVMNALNDFFATQRFNTRINSKNISTVDGKINDNLQASFARSLPEYDIQLNFADLNFDSNGNLIGWRQAIIDSITITSMPLRN